MLSVLTYNIWFSKFIWEKRLDALESVIDRYKPDIVCVQELRQEVHDAFLDRFNDEYDIQLKDFSQTYDCCIMVRKTPDIVVDTSIVVPYEYSIMMRNLHMTVISHKGQKYVIGNTHYESIFDKSDDRIQNKYSQYVMSKDIMEITGSEVLNDSKDETIELILCCDSNLTAEDGDIFDKTFNEWKDCWDGKMDGHTYNTETNPYLKKISKRIVSRLDRILINGRSKVVESKVISKLTDDKIKLEPSDHYGVFTTLSIE